MHWVNRDVGQAIDLTHRPIDLGRTPVIEGRLEQMPLFVTYRVFGRGSILYKSVGYTGIEAVSRPCAFKRLHQVLTRY
jgi:hypothetical protein